MVDILQAKVHGRTIMGHNMLAGFSYFILFHIFLLQTITGFALYSNMGVAFPSLQDLKLELSPEVRKAVPHIA